MKLKTPSYQRTRLACYVAYFTMSSVFCVPPLLFATLRDLYGISYTLLGTLVLVNFCTQLSVDLLFSFFSAKFTPKKLVRVMPLITSVGLFVYALIPFFFPHIAYAGLLLGTVIFSISAGLSEVLLSPTIAAMPSEHPQKDMSILHSLYALGVFSMVLISTFLLRVFNAENWHWLVIVLGLFPIVAAVMFMRAPMPDMRQGELDIKAKGTRRRRVGLALCMACIFLGSCSENTMSNWISGYVEKALGVDKTLGDLLGMAMFAILLWIARIIYAKYGKSIAPTLLIGMMGAVVCYLVAGLSTSIIVALIACVMTGFFTAMLWPGTLILMEEKIPNAGVAAFALMAAGGDLGASFAPQLMGITIDRIAASSFAATLAERLELSTEQIGLKSAMLLSAIFPIMGTLLVLYIIRFFRKHPMRENNL